MPCAEIWAYRLSFAKLSDYCRKSARMGFCRVFLRSLLMFGAARPAFRRRHLRGREVGVSVNTGRIYSLPVCRLRIRALFSPASPFVSREAFPSPPLLFLFPPLVFFPARLPAGSFAFLAVFPILCLFEAIYVHFPLPDFPPLFSPFPIFSPPAFFGGPRPPFPAPPCGGKVFLAGGRKCRIMSQC